MTVSQNSKHQTFELGAFFNGLGTLCDVVVGKGCKACTYILWRSLASVEIPRNSYHERFVY